MSESLDRRIVDIRTKRPWRPAEDRTAAVFGLQAAVTTVVTLLGLLFFIKMQAGG
jgi:hypothetical protein